MIQKLKKLKGEKNLSSLMANLVTAVLGLISFMLLTRQLSTERFGDWVLFLALTNFADSIRYGLTRTSVVRLLTNADKEQIKQLLGSSFRLSCIVLIIFWVILWLTWGIWEHSGWQVINGYKLFLIWYPVFGLAALGWKNAYGLFQAEQNFNRMMLVRVSNIGLFVLFLMINLLWLKLEITSIIIVYITTNLISSMWCTFRKWDGLFYLNHADKITERQLFHFGKYSMGSLIGSNLLKSADTFIIGSSTLMGPEAIAMYAIPLKLTDLIGIPLKSFSMTAYPRLSKQFLKNNMEEVKHIFYSYTGAVTFILSPFILLCYLFAEPLVYILGGDGYLSVIDELVLVLRIFTLYLFFLPFDRFLGILFDSIDQPKLNLFKVLAMASANIAIDLIAVHYFQSLALVAIGTVTFTLIGIGVGLFLIRDHLQINLKNLVAQTILFFKNFKEQLP